MPPETETLYAASAGPASAYPPLSGTTTADVLIVGGGYTGLSAALHLAEAGVDVALVEAERVGWGASGRNGGQLHSGQRRDQDWLEDHVGLDDARKLWSLAEEAKALVKDLIRRHAIDCDWRDGLIEAVHKPRLVAGERAYVDKLRGQYGYTAATWLDRDALAAAIGTSVYFGGRHDATAGHLDPVKFARGLAAAAARAGARIYEGTRVTKITPVAGASIEIDCRPATWLMDTAAGRAGPRINAGVVLLAGNGYLEGVDADVEARVMPIDNYILATEPIGAGQPGGLIPAGEAVSDTRFVVYYFRPSPDGRLVFGGGETYGEPASGDLRAFVRDHLIRIYPQLAGTRIDYAWGGTLAITRHRLPYIRRVHPGVYAAAGYSGQGVALAPLAGKVIADAIRGDTGRFDTFAKLPVPLFPGGRTLRKPILTAAMLWYALRDRI